MGAIHRAMTGFRAMMRAIGWPSSTACTASTSVTSPRSGRRHGSRTTRRASERVGQPLDCPLCDRAELPEGLRPTRTTATWDAVTVPPRSAAPIAWPQGRGASSRSRPARSASEADTDAPIDVVVTPADGQPIPPELDHHIEPSEDARFHVTFLVPGYEPAGKGGEPACIVHLLEEDERF